VLASRRPQDFVVSVRAPGASDLGRGWQWFSVQRVTESDRPQRVAATMPRFVAAVGAWQLETGIGAHATALVGFSQGAIMALEATQQPQPLAARVIAIAGRFAEPPRVAPPQLDLHVLHGADDPLMPVALAAAAAAQWRALGGQAALHIFPGLGHGLDGRVVQRVAGTWRRDTMSPPSVYAAACPQRGARIPPWWSREGPVEYRPYAAECGCAAAPIFVRRTRGQVLTVKVEDYVEAARAVGNPPWRIALLHILLGRRPAGCAGSAAAVKAREPQRHPRADRRCPHPARRPRPHERLHQFRLPQGRPARAGPAGELGVTSE
jgi:phospholipase/carboxylesterase